MAEIRGRGCHRFGTNGPRHAYAEGMKWEHPDRERALALHSKRRPVLAIAAVLLVLAACVESTEATSTTGPVASSTTIVESVASDAPNGTYRMGMIEDVTTDNHWAITAGGSAYDHLASYGTHSALFGFTPDAAALVPDIALGVPEPAVAEGDSWVVEQKIRSGYLWMERSGG